MPYIEKNIKWRLWRSQRKITTVVKTLQSLFFNLNLIIFSFNPFLRTIAQLRKGTISFVMSSCLSDHSSAWNDSAHTGHTITKFDIWGFLKNILRKFKFYQNLTRIIGTLHDDLCTLWQYLAELFFEWEMFQTKAVEKIKTQHILYSVTFIQNCAIYGIMWKIWYSQTGHMTNNTTQEKCDWHAG